MVDVCGCVVMKSLRCEVAELCMRGFVGLLIYVVVYCEVVDLLSC